MDLNKFKEWQAEAPERSVRLDIETRDGVQFIQAWVYNYKLMKGQHVSDVSEIDLEAVKEKEDKKEYDRLQKKYGGAT